MIDPNDAELDEDLPREAQRLGYREGLGIVDIQSIQKNARQQGRRPTLDEMLRAFVHYLDHDAFIDFS